MQSKMIYAVAALVFLICCGARSCHAQSVQTACYIPINSSAAIIQPSGQILTNTLPAMMSQCAGVLACKVRFGPGAYNVFPGGQVYYGDTSGVVGCTLAQITAYSQSASQSSMPDNAAADVGETTYQATGLQPLTIDVMSRIATVQLMGNTTFIMADGYAGQNKVITWCQNGGIFKVTPPANVTGLQQPGLTCSSQSFDYYPSLHQWKASGPILTAQ